MKNKFKLNIPCHDKINIAVKESNRLNRISHKFHVFFFH